MFITHLRPIHLYFTNRFITDIITYKYLKGCDFVRKIRFGIKFSLKMLQIAIKRIIYPIKKNRLTEDEREKYLYNIENNWAKATMKYSELEIDVQGKENLIDEPCVYICNHQSVLDVPLIMANINTVVGAIAKIELKKVPIASYWIEEVGSVYIDRENGREGLKSILKGVEQLKNGRSMLVFPEGTRSRCSKMSEFKKGSLKLAIKANVPIILITVDGTYKGLEGEEQDMRAKIIFHKPIYVDELTKDEKGNLVNLCKEIIEKPLIEGEINK